MPAISKTTVTQSGVTFSVEPAATHLGVKLDNDSENGSPIVNAVNIDWNGAVLGGTTINTTGDLLSYISSKVGSGSGSGSLASINVSFS